MGCWGEVFVVPESSFYVSLIKPLCVYSFRLLLSANLLLRQSFSVSAFSRRCCCCHSLLPIFVSLYSCFLSSLFPPHSFLVFLSCNFCLPAVTNVLGISTVKAINAWQKKNLYLHITVDLLCPTIVNAVFFQAVFGIVKMTKWFMHKVYNEFPIKRCMFKICRVLHVCM